MSQSNIEPTGDFLVSEEELAAMEGAEPQFEAAPDFVYESVAPAGAEFDSQAASVEGEAAADADGGVEGAESRDGRSFSSLPERTGASLSSLGVSAEQVARAAAQALYDRKIEDICALDLTALSDVCDFFVIGTGLNTRMVDSAVDEVEDKVARACGEKPFSIEGRAQRTWVLMDYGAVVVHVFTPEARDYYRLERLWGDAPLLELELD